MVSIAASGIWQGITVGAPLSYRGLQIMPLLGRSSADPSYRVFEQETAPHVEITEVGEGGSVPTLRVKNKLPDRLLLLDGQHLLGAKQNRIVNADVLIAAGTEVTIPVSCVERGRWASTSHGFSSGGMGYHEIRSRKAAYVMASLRSGTGHRSDQGAVWKDVDAMMSKLSVASSTSAMADAFAQKENELRQAREALQLPPGALGIAVYEGSRLRGLDLFDRAETFVRAWQSLLDSYVLDKLAAGSEPAAQPGGEAGDAPAAVSTLVEGLAEADWERFDAAGEGTDLRWKNECLLASALVVGGAVLHLQAFPRLAEGDPAAMDVRPLTMGPPGQAVVVTQPSVERATNRSGIRDALHGLMRYVAGKWRSHR